MNNKSKLTEDQKLQLLKDYNDGVRVSAIADALGITKSSVSRIAQAMGASARKTKKVRDIYKICPKCHKHIEVKGAKFCCFCGADIRSNKELLVERITSSMTKLKYLPDDARDEMQKLLIDIKNELIGG